MRYHQLIEATRPKPIEAGESNPWQVAFRHLLLQDLTRRSGLTRLLCPEIEAMEQLLPPRVPESFIDRLPTITPTRKNRRSRMALLLGSS